MALSTLFDGLQAAGVFGPTPTLGGSATPTASQAATGTVNLSKLKSGSAAYYAGEDWNKFMTDYGPILQQQLATLNSTKMVDKAAEDARVVPGLMESAADRAAARRGGKTNTQSNALTAFREKNRATTTAGLMNNSRLDQRQRNTDTAYKLSGLGTDVYQMGLDNVRESEGLATQRRMNNAASKQAQKQNMLGLGMTAAAAFLL